MNERDTSSPDEPTPRELFDELADLPSDQQRARLAELEVRSSPLAAAVRKLLAADAEAGAFLQSPTLSPASVPMPAHVGAYKLLQLIGEGGFGAVYMAEQTVPVRRRVAVKIIKPGMDSRQVVARFEAERQALAMMDHPNIARIFDAGQSADGRPYFVMELVTGVPITQFCDENRFDIRQRLSLLADVCRAVQHAHQKAIIHRDIKPNNVLVTLHDGRAVPKVIDFGIAKALDQPLTDKTLFTEFKTMIGTPEYMSPEQAEISGLDIDTRCDVYSLGVLMYELLVGVTPFDGAELRSKAYGEMQRIIREVDPPSPSTRLSSLNTAVAVAQSRRSDLRRLGSVVRGELDWIVMRCLEKDRTRRYDSAAALAKDIEAYLAGAAVEASPPSVMYALRKFAGRHRALIGTASAIIAALVIGLIATALALRHARAQQRLAEANALAAERESNRARVVSDFLLQTIAFADPYRGAGDPRISQVFEQAGKDLDAGLISRDAETEALLRSVIGKTALRISRVDIAIPQLERSLAFRRGENPQNTKELARILDLVSTAEINRANYARAESLSAEAEALAKASGDQQLLEDVLYNRATGLLTKREYAAAITLLNDLLARKRPRVAEEADGVALVLEGLATAQSQSRDYEAALKSIREAVEIRRDRLNKSGRKYADDRALIESTALLANILGMSGRDREAVTELEAAIELVSQQDRPSLGTMTMLREMLAARLGRLGERARATELLRQVVEARAQFDGPTHPRVAQAKGNLGLELYRAGKKDEAKQQWQQAWAIVRDRTDMPRGGAGEIASLLATVTEENESPSNIQLYETALKDIREDPPRPIYANTLLNFWLAQYTAGRYDDALRLAEEIAIVAPKVYPAGSSELSQAFNVVARSLLKSGSDVSRAETFARKSVAGYEANPPRVAAQLHHARSVLGDALLRQGKLDEASKLIEEADAVLGTDPAAAGLVREESADRLRRLRAAKPATTTHGS